MSKKQLFLALVNHVIDLHNLENYLCDAVQLDLYSKPVQDVMHLQTAVGKLINETFELEEASDKYTTFDWWFEGYCMDKVEDQHIAYYENDEGEMIKVNVKTPEDLYDYLVKCEEIEENE